MSTSLFTKFLFLDKVDYHWWLFRIKNINLIIIKIFLSLSGVTNHKHISAHYKLVTKTDE